MGYSVKARPAKRKMGCLVKLSKMGTLCDTPSPESIAMNVFQRSDRSARHSSVTSEQPRRRLLANQPADSDTESCTSVSGGVAPSICFPPRAGGWPSLTRSTMIRSSARECVDLGLLRIEAWPRQLPLTWMGFPNKAHFLVISAHLDSKANLCTSTVPSSLHLSSSCTSSLES